MVIYSRCLVYLRQQVLEMTFPTRWIPAVSMTTARGTAQYRLDATPAPGGGFGLACPKGG